MSKSGAAGKGAIYGLISHLLIILGGQAIFIFLMFGANISQGLAISMSLQANGYACSFYLGMLLLGLLAGRSMGRRIAGQPERFLTLGAVYGLLVAVISIVLVIVIMSRLNGWEVAVTSMKQPAVLFLVLFLVVWVLLAKVMQASFRRSAHTATA